MPRSGPMAKSRLIGAVREGRKGMRATSEYYGKSGIDERRLVKASFFMGITGGILWYVLIMYWAALDFTSEQIGLMGGTGSAVGILSYLIGGYLADVMGRKRLFLAGLAATAAGLCLFLTERNLAVFTLAYALTSMGGSLTWPSLTALMAEKVAPSQMKYFFGVQEFVNQVGLTVATFFGIFSPEWMDLNLDVNLTAAYGYVFAVTALCAIPPIFYLLRVSEKRPEPSRLRVHFDKRMRRMLGAYCLQNAIIGAGAGFVIPWLPVIFDKGMGASQAEVAYIITLANVVLAVGWFIVPRFADLRGSVTLIAFLQMASVVPMLLIPFAPTLVVLALLYTARSFLMLVPSPVLVAYLMNVVSTKIRASFLAISQVAWQLAYSVAYASAGYLWANEYDKVEPFFIAGALYVLASVIFFAYFRTIREPVEQAANIQK